MLYGYIYDHDANDAQARKLYDTSKAVLATMEKFEGSTGEIDTDVSTKGLEKGLTKEDAVANEHRLTRSKV